MAIGLFADALGRDEAVVRKRGVDDPALERVHRLELDGSAALRRLEREVLGELGQGDGALFAIVLAVQNDALVKRILLVGDEQCQILHAVQSVAAIADQNRRVLARQLDAVGVLFVEQRRGAIEVHRLDQSVYECDRALLRRLLDRRADGDLLPDQTARLDDLGVDPVLGHPQFFRGLCHRLFKRGCRHFCFIHLFLPPETTMAEPFAAFFFSICL